MADVLRFVGLNAAKVTVPPKTRDHDGRGLKATHYGLIG
jgi:hypothetical protein